MMEPGTDIEISRRRGAMLEEVASWDQHRDLSGPARRQVFGALVRLEQEPTMEETDQLLDLVGPHHQATLKQELPESTVTAIFGSQYSGFTVEDLIADVGVKPVHAAFEYVRESGSAGALADAEIGEDAFAGVVSAAPKNYPMGVLLAATKLSIVYEAETAEAISALVGAYAETHRISREESLAQLLNLEPLEAEKSLLMISRPVEEQADEPDIDELDDELDS